LIYQQQEGIDCENIHEKCTNAIGNIQNAQKEFNKENYIQAIQFYNSVININPDDPNVQEWIDMCNQKKAEQIDKKKLYAISLFDKGNYGETIQIAMQVLKLDPKNDKAIQLLCKSHFWRAMSNLTQKDYDKLKFEYERSQKYNIMCNNCIRYMDLYSTKDLENHYQAGSSKIGVNNNIYDYIDSLAVVKCVNPGYKQVSYHLKRLKNNLKNFKYVVVNKFNNSDNAEKEQLGNKLRKIDSYLKLLEILETTVH